MGTVLIVSFTAFSIQLLSIHRHEDEFVPASTQATVGSTEGDTEGDSGQGSAMPDVDGEEDDDDSGAFGNILLNSVPSPPPNYDE